MKATESASKGAGKKADGSVPARLNVRTAASEEDERANELDAIERHRQWLQKTASSIESGKLPDHAMERQMIAGILRHRADNLSLTTPPKRRGNPEFKAAFNHGGIALDMELEQRKENISQLEAAENIAARHGIDASTVQKIHRKYRVALSNFFANVKVKPKDIK